MTKEQVLAVLDQLEWGFQHRRCPVCAGFNCGPNGETDRMHTATCPVPQARAAIASWPEPATWRPISEGNFADQRRVFCRHHERVPFVARYLHGEGWVDIAGNYRDPTHFMEIPQ